MILSHSRCHATSTAVCARDFSKSVQETFSASQRESSVPTLTARRSQPLHPHLSTPCEGDSTRDPKQMDL